MKRVLVALLAGVGLAFATAWIERDGQPRVVDGEGFCGLTATGPCVVETFGGGWPFVYLVNNPQISVPTTLAFVEDDFHPAPFVADVAVFAVLAYALLGVRRRNPASGPLSPRGPSEDKAVS